MNVGPVGADRDEYANGAGACREEPGVSSDQIVVDLHARCPPARCRNFNPYSNVISGYRIVVYLDAGAAGNFNSTGITPWIIGIRDLVLRDFAAIAIFQKETRKHVMHYDVCLESTITASKCRNADTVERDGHSLDLRIGDVVEGYALTTRLEKPVAVNFYLA